MARRLRFPSRAGAVCGGRGAKGGRSLCSNLPAPAPAPLPKRRSASGHAFKILGRSCPAELGAGGGGKGNAWFDSPRSHLDGSSTLRTRGPSDGIKSTPCLSPAAPEGNSCLGNLSPPSSLAGGTLRNEPRNSKCVIPQLKTLIFVLNTGVAQYKDEG